MTGDFRSRQGYGPGQGDRRGADYRPTDPDRGGAFRPQGFGSPVARGGSRNNCFPWGPYSFWRREALGPLDAACEACAWVMQRSQPHAPLLAGQQHVTAFSPTGRPYSPPDRGGRYPISNVRPRTILECLASMCLTMGFPPVLGCCRAALLSSPPHALFVIMCMQERLNGSTYRRDEPYGRPRGFDREPAGRDGGGRESGWGYHERERRSTRSRESSPLPSDHSRDPSPTPRDQPSSRRYSDRADGRRGGLDDTCVVSPRAAQPDIAASAAAAAELKAPPPPTPKASAWDPVPSLPTGFVVGTGAKPAVPRSASLGAISSTTAAMPALPPHLAQPQQQAQQQGPGQPHQVAAGGLGRTGSATGATAPISQHAPPRANISSEALQDGLRPGRGVFDAPPTTQQASMGPWDTPVLPVVASLTHAASDRAALCALDHGLDALPSAPLPLSAAAERPAHPVGLSSFSDIPMPQLDALQPPAQGMVGHGSSSALGLADTPRHSSWLLPPVEELGGGPPDRQPSAPSLSLTALQQQQQQQRRFGFGISRRGSTATGKGGEGACNC